MIVQGPPGMTSPVTTAVVLVAWPLEGTRLGEAC